MVKRINLIIRTPGNRSETKLSAAIFSGVHRLFGATVVATGTSLKVRNGMITNHEK